MEGVNHRSNRDAEIKDAQPFSQVLGIRLGVVAGVLTGHRNTKDSVGAEGINGHGRCQRGIDSPR